jgi:hypothetical protein
MGPRLVEAEDIAQHRDDGVGFFCFRSERPEPCRQLASGHIEGVAGRHLVGFAEQRPEHTVGALTQGRACGLPHRDPGEPAVGLKPPHELGDQPRLAGSCLADQVDDLGSASLHPLKGRVELVELVGTSDHRRDEPMRRKPAGRTRLRQRTDQAVNHERLRFAAQ